MTPEEKESKVVRAALDAFATKLQEGIAELGDEGRVFPALVESGPHIHKAIVLEGGKTYAVLTALWVTEKPNIIEAILEAESRKARA